MRSSRNIILETETSMVQILYTKLQTLYVSHAFISTLYKVKQNESQNMGDVVLPLLHC